MTTLSIPPKLSITQALDYFQSLTGRSDTARLDVEVLLSSVLQKDRAYFYTWPETLLSDEEVERFTNFFQRRLLGEPIAYIVGEQEFWTLTLQVNSSTLIPRADTELLVETALSLFPADFPCSVIDLGTGTGAIALALASEKPHWDIVAVDNNQDACSLAETNRQIHQLPNVMVMQSFWLQELNTLRANLIVSNPPYIDEADPHLLQGDVRYEPHSALTAKNNGLADIEMIVNESTQHLLPDGWLLIEHGYQQAEAVIKLMQAHGFTACFTANDLAGHPRVTAGEYASQSAVNKMNAEAEKND